MAKFGFGMLQIRDNALRLRPRVNALLGSVLLFVAAAVLSGNLTIKVTFLAVALVMLVITTCAWSIAQIEAYFSARSRKLVEKLLFSEPSPVFLTDSDGAVEYANPAAIRAFDTGGKKTLTGALHNTLANPTPVLCRLKSQAALHGTAVEDIVTRQGHLRIHTHSASNDRFLWRLEKTVENPPASSDALPVPMLTLGQDETILYINNAARELIGERVLTLDRICERLPLRPGQLNEICTNSGIVSCLAVEIEASVDRQEILLLPNLDLQITADGWAIFDELPVPLLKLSRSGEIRLSNRPARALLGLDSCAGRRLADLMEGPGRPISDWLDDAAAKRGTVHSEFLRVRRSDKEVFVQVTLNPVPDAGETALIAVLNDATKLKSLEAQFVQSQKMQAIGQLAGGVAHDFNNLLTAISGHCDLLLLRHDQEDPDYSDLIQIHQNSNRAATLVNQLLAFSRKQTLCPEVMDLRDMLADLTHLLNRLVGEKIKLTLGHDPQLWAVRADKRQLEQVLMNLVVNARDAMREGGEVKISTGNCVLTKPLLRSRAVVAPGRYVSVKVSDAGVGIPQDKLQKIFEPFYTTKRPGEGTGLGLSTAYGIVKQTGGFIFADSTPGEGTEFQLLLPAHDSEIKEPSKKLAMETSDAPAEGVVLLVEDEAPVRAFASRALQMRGFAVLEAECAEHALELLNDSNVEVDVFVTDVVMPGMDGPTWVLKALENRPDTKVVFVSGYAEETFVDARAKIPNSVFLPKPFSLTELTDTVLKQLT